MSAQGRDYSSWQASMNLTGLSFVIMRATIGSGGLNVGGSGAVTNGVDDKFAQFWQQAAPLHRGAYHFLYPSGDPVVQADLFLRTVKAAGLRPGDMLYCDSETYADNVDALTKAFCDRVRSQVPAANPVGVYSNHDVGQHLTATAAAYPDTYWFAWPSATAPPSSFTAPWRQWRFWQWGQRGVDADAYNGQPADLDAWIASYTGGDVPLTPDDLTAIALAVWGDQFKEFYDEDGSGTRDPKSAVYTLYETLAAVLRNRDAITALQAAVAALQAKIGDPVDETALAAALAPVIQSAITAAGQADAQTIASAVAATFAGKLGA